MASYDIYDNNGRNEIAERDQDFGKPEFLMSFSNATLWKMLRQYLLSYEQLSKLGYPLEWPGHPGFVTILNQSPYSQQCNNRDLRNTDQKPGVLNLDVNAREFVPSGSPTLTYANIVSGNSSAEVDSGRGSSNSVFNLNVNAREFVPCGSPSYSISSSHESSDTEQESSSDTEIGDHHPVYVPENAIERRCSRCTKPFYVNRIDGEYLCEDTCRYHWGKLHRGSWKCWDARQSSHGCTIARTHVWTGLVAGINSMFKKFVTTEPARHIPLDGDYGVYALDCEMCFTKHGLDIGRVTLVDLDGIVIYDTVVQPDAPIIDYNTRFSGLSAEDFTRAKSLHDVQQELLRGPPSRKIFLLLPSN